MQNPDEKRRHDVHEDEAPDSPSSDSYPKGIRLTLIMVSLMLGTALMDLDATIISVATPKISTHFQALDDVGWYGASYSMLLTAFTPIASNFYKYFHPKYVYLASIIVFEGGSILCAAAPSSSSFIAGRAIAGIGAAGLLQGAFGILTYVCTLEKRPLFLGGVVSLFGLFSSIGPVLGGELTEKTSWRWCFWILVFVGIVFALSLTGLDETTRKLPLATKAQKLDLPGVVLLVASGGIKFPWSHAEPIGLLVGFVVVFVLFGLWQWKAGEDVTVPLRYLKHHNMASYITIYYMPFYFQAALNQSPLKSGVSYMSDSLAVPQMIGLIAGGGITTATGHYMPVILVAQVLCATGAGLLTTITPSTATALWATYMVFCGLGLGLGVNVPHIAIQAVMETDNDVFIANGIASFFGQLGGSLGVPVGNAILIRVLKSTVPEQAPGISPDAVIDAGALALSSLSNLDTLVAVLRYAWAISVGRVQYISGRHHLCQCSNGLRDELVKHQDY
ncbi:MFS general substrate transporter [Pleomassaria siparia CBS 279.74]|uniref:MFS general substrate transporter n=1 Tax=Pleomassaria siparia CBS 279.74 TaxID=1314801 RepID=A0A6G1JVA1_9PLEO|nr:MFS general substrate transporter [Pleomassaria siparia CBS 279.74]